MKGRDKKKSLKRILQYLSEVELYKYISITLIILYVIDVFATAFTFHFVHANIFHLITNLLAVSVIVKSWKRLLLAYVVTTALYIAHGPVIGFSAIIFFLWGSYMVGHFINGKNRLNTVAAILFSMTCSYFVPNVSFEMHLYPFIWGVVFSGIIYLYKMALNDLKSIY